MEQLEDNTKEYFKTYQVEDVVYSTAEILFILESPHVEEIKNGYPVAGNSGREMTRFIYADKPNEPFGNLVNNGQQYKKEYPEINKFGLMNVCPAPMQKQALKDFELAGGEEKVLSILEKLRVNYQANRHRAEEWNRVKVMIINNFHRRLEKVLKKYKQISYLVPCGKFAANYLRLVKEDLPAAIEIINGVPHPSFNQWHDDKVMRRLEEGLTDIFGEDFTK